MRQFSYVLSLTLAALSFISCAGSPQNAASPSNPLLYVVSGGSVTPYSVDPVSLAATALQPAATLVSTAFRQFDPSPNDHFVYGIWSDAQNIQHLSAFQTDPAGVPQLPAIQELNANSLSQFNMHPSRGFAYMLQVTTVPGGYEASIRLFTVSSKNGRLKESPYVQGRYGPAPYWPAFLYGFSVNGSKLYDMSNVATGTVYRERSINLTTGALGPDTTLLSMTGESPVAIGKVIVAQYQSDVAPSQNYLDVFSNIANPTRPTIRCTAAMLRTCSTATYVQLDRSSNFLFLTDPTTQSIHVASIDLKSGRILATGSTLPMTSQTPGLAFSRDGNILYALAKDELVHFYHFDQSSGSLTEGGTPLSIPPGAGISPAQYR